jgi:hypothetical protein
MSVLLPTKPVGLNINPGSGTSTENTFAVDGSGLYIFDNNGPNTNVTLKTNNVTALFIDNRQRIGIHCINPTSRLMINDENGDCIRLIYNNNINSNYAYIKLGQDGSLILEPYENSFVNIKSVGNTTGLKLNDKIIFSSADQLNYTNISTPGNAEGNKCLVLDGSRSASGINSLNVDNLVVNNTFSLNIDSPNYAFTIANKTGNCLKLINKTHYTTFSVLDSGILNIYNSMNTIELLCDNNNSLIYPLKLTTSNNLINSGVGIEFNTYNINNIKRNMSTIETIITNNENNNENSIIKFNNMNNGNLSNTVTIRQDGYILCNTLMELSDARKKKIIKKSNYNESLKKITKIKTYDFTYIDDSQNKIHKGIMAQELHKIIPSAVSIGEHYTISNKELIGYLIDCIKSLSETINNIKNKIYEDNYIMIDKER